VVIALLTRDLTALVSHVAPWGDTDSTAIPEQDPLDLRAFLSSGSGVFDGMSRHARAALHRFHRWVS
jgi:hypothetical protein